MSTILELSSNGDGVVDDRTKVCWPIHFSDVQLIAIMFDYLFDTGTVGMLCVSVQRELE